MKIGSIIDEMKKQYDDKYGYAIFFVDAHIKDKSLILSGEVLLSSQKAELEKRLESVFSGSIDNQISVLSDLSAKTEIGWGVARSVPVNVFQYPPFCEAKRKIFSTQIYQPNDIVRILHKKDGYYLVQLIDFTLGWVEQTKVSLLAGDKRTAFDVVRPLKGELIDVPSRLKSRLTSMARDYLNVKYVWGGITKNGIDCSGFTQRLYRDVFGIILPKHSKAQRRLGVRVGLDEIRFADLIFLRGKAKNISHVGIFLEDSVAHASLNQKKVVFESMKTILDLYRFVGVRRYIKLT